MPPLKHIRTLLVRALVALASIGRTPQARRVRDRVTGRDWWLLPDGRTLLPAMGGGDGAEDEAAKAAADAKAAEEAKAAETKAAADKAAADAEAAKKAEAALGDPGKAALDAERTARKAAEKAAKDAQAKLDAIENDKLSETDKLKKEAEQGKQAAATATEKLRKANLITALADQGLTGGRAKAAAKLLDAVQYDDDDEPTNLEAALTAAKTVYGADMFEAGESGGGERRQVNVNGRDGNNGGKAPKLTAEELEMAKSFGMTAEEYAANKSTTPPEPKPKKKD